MGCVAIGFINEFGYVSCNKWKYVATTRLHMGFYAGNNA